MFFETAELRSFFSQEPFTTYYLNNHEEKFDSINRTFASISGSWQNCQRDSSDVKELIPEFFSLPEMLTNCNNYKLGRTTDGQEIDDVVLPRWAKTPEDFIRLNRAVGERAKDFTIGDWIFVQGLGIGIRFFPFASMD